MKILNKKALYDYQILDRYEAGMMLSGAEAKAVRAGRVQLGAAFVRLRNGEAWLINMQVPMYEHARVENYAVDRTRKLLLKKSELLKLSQLVQNKGITLVPVSIYTRGGLVKLEVGVAKGKKEYEKRDIIQKRETDLEMRRAVRGKR